jgi:hypothetical protein
MNDKQNAVEDEVIDEVLTDEQEAEDFAAGFSGDEATPKKEELVVELEPEPEPELTDEQKESEMLARIEKKFADRLRSVEGHIGGLKSQIETFKEQAKPGQIDLDKMLAGEKMQELKEFLPESYDAMVEAFGAVGAPAQVDIESLIDKRMAEMSQQPGQTTAETVKAARDMARLDRDHPTWEEDVNSIEYKNWLSLQDNDIIDLALNSTNVADASKVLTLWEQRQDASNSNLTAQSRQRQAKQSKLERAVAPTKGSNTPAPKAQPSEHDEFLAGYNDG